MLVIRYRRIGKKNQPSFKIVVIDKRKSSRGGRFVEILGFYNPLTKKKNIKKERAQYWLSKGAKPSDAIHNLLIEAKIIEGKKKPVHSKKKVKEGEKTAPVATAAAPAAETAGTKPAPEPAPAVSEPEKAPDKTEPKLEEKKETLAGSAEPQPASPQQQVEAGPAPEQKP